jgi:hypothetical protein
MVDCVSLAPLGAPQTFRGYPRSSAGLQPAWWRTEPWTLPPPRNRQREREARLLDEVAGLVAALAKLREQYDGVVRRLTNEQKENARLRIA